MDGAVSDRLDSWGYPLLFVLVGLESLGVPVPGETALLAAAAWAALGHLSITAVVAVAAGPAAVGDNRGAPVGRGGRGPPGRPFRPPPPPHPTAPGRARPAFVPARHPG